jgi:hypothetical protein
LDRPNLLVSFEELNDLMGFKQIKEMEQRYLRPDQLSSKYDGASAATSH